YAVSAEEDSPATTLERAELERLIAACIDRIPKVEKTVLSLYFYEELTLREIAEVMGIHLSRVCQIKSQAILRLRTAIAKRWPGLIKDDVGNDARSGLKGELAGIRA